MPISAYRLDPEYKENIFALCSVYTPMSTQGPVLDWPFVSDSWIGVGCGSGSNRNPGENQSFDLPSPSDTALAAVRFHVLIVDDNEADVFLIQKAMEATQLPLTLHIAKDGEKAIQFFDEADISSKMPCPSLVLLDINLPKKQGGEVLRHMRQSHKCADALVLIVSTSDSPKDREQMKALGADGYFRKPSKYDEFMKLSDIVKGLLGGSGL